jgi:hypothetical protein
MTTLLEKPFLPIPNELSSRPKRTRISCHAALDKAACAPFRKEGRMNYFNATKFHRKSGGAQWRDLLCLMAARRRFARSTTDTPAK